MMTHRSLLMNQLERVGLECKDQGEYEGEDEGEAKGMPDI